MGVRKVAKKQKVLISSRCEKCGKSQESSKEQSTVLFEVFDCHENCKCGGKFIMCIDEEKMNGRVGDKSDYAADLSKNKDAKDIKKSLMCFETLNVIMAGPEEAKE
jgi:hypothetical protein